MPDPSYTLVLFSWNEADTTLSTALTQVIDGKTWRTYINASGQDAQTIWDARGETEAQIIARLLALP